VTGTSRVVRLTPFKRNVLVTQYRLRDADFEEHKWLLKLGTTERWYEKPDRTYLKQSKALEGTGCEPAEFLPLHNARPVSLETPRVCASPALTTPIDDDVYECTDGHTIDAGYGGTCHQCSEEKSEALETTSLVYYIVLSTCQASDPFIHGAHFNGKQIYKMIRCGSREAAVAEAFYAAGVNGWTVAFSCITRLDQDFDDTNGKVEKVDKLWMLAEEEKTQGNIRIFF
jgi:hypothetical protein